MNLTVGLTIVSATLVFASYFLATEKVYASEPRRCESHNVLVVDKAGLEKELEKACPGSVIRLNTGAWRDLVITIRARGSREFPITVKADKPGQVFIERRSTIRLTGQHTHLEGLYFRYGAPASREGAVVLDGQYNVLTETVIDAYNYPNKKFNHTSWVSLKGKNNTVHHNHFKNKSVKGALLKIRRDSDDTQHHSIRHNHFENFFSGKDENGWETIQIGSSDFSRSNSNTTVENNFFENSDGEIEIISVKSGKNIIRNNTFLDSQGLLTLRHGLGNVVESNVFLAYGKRHAGGVRIYDGNHVIRNNYIAGVKTNSKSRGGVVIHSGINKPEEKAESLNAHWTPYNLVIENNTIVDSEQSYVFCGSKKYVAKNVTFKNNIIYSRKDSPFMRIDKAPNNLSFEDDWYITNKVYQGTGDYQQNWYVGPAESFDARTGVSFIAFDDERGILNDNGRGLFLHKTKGAQNLTVLTADDVGPKTY